MQKEYKTIKEISGPLVFVEKTEPVFASSDEEIKEVGLEDNSLDIVKKEEFNAEETDSSEIDDEFNQETEEELLDIPTFLRRQAN